MATENEPKTLDDLLSDVLAENGITVDQDSEEDITFEYTNQQVKELIVRGRVRLLLKHPFFGTLATRLKLVETDGWCKTAAVDGKHFYYNPDFFRTLKPAEIDFVVGHEVLHVVYQHCGDDGRFMDMDEKERDHNLFNIAADYKVNQGCVESGVGTMPSTALHDRKYYSMSTEEIYNHLKKNGQGGGGGKVMDLHLFGDSDSDETKGLKNDPSGRTGPIKISKAQAAALKEELKYAVLQAAQSSGAGNLPAGVKRMIENYTNPIMDWRELLNLTITSCLKNDYTWMRRSKKSQSMGVYLPAQKPDQTVEAAIALDVSGSISHQMLRDFLGEVQGIMGQFTDFKLWIWTFDTKVYDESFKEFTPFNADEILTYEIIGGGGTDFECNWDFMKERDINPDKLVMFTDGYPNGSWGDSNYCDTLFVIHGSDKIVPPFGEHAYYKK